MPHWISHDRQELFDNVVRKMAAQGAQSSRIATDMGSGIQCLYLKEDGHRCAIGHCLTEVGIALAANNLATVEDLALSVALEDNTAGMPFLLALQKAHDASRSRKNFKNRLLEVVYTYSLDRARVDELLTAEWCSVETW